MASGRVCAGSRYDWNLAVHLGNRFPNDLEVFLFGEGRGFSGGAARHDSGNPRIQLSGHEAFQVRIGDGPVFHGCDESSVRSVK